LLSSSSPSRQFQLFDLAIGLLRRPAKTRAAEHGQLHLQLFDMQGLRVQLLLERLIPIPKRRCKSAQFIGIFR